MPIDYSTRAEPRPAPDPAIYQQFADHARQTQRPSYCKRCYAPILWAESEATKRPIPLDKEPVPTGNLVFVDYGVIRYCRPGHRPPGGELTPRFQSHFASCPFAKAFRS